jgi:hypothetical protein
VKRGTVLGALTNFALILITLVIVELALEFGFRISEWNLQDARLVFNGSLAAALAVMFLLIERWR